MCLDQLGHAIVERRKLSLVVLRQGQKIRIGHLAMSNEGEARKHGDDRCLLKYAASQHHLLIVLRAAAPLSPLHRVKHAMTGLTRALSLEGREYDIACGQIDIGNAATRLTARIAAGSMQADGTTASEPTMDVENVAATVVYMAGLPPEANVQFLTVMATKMPFIGRGRRVRARAVGACARVSVNAYAGSGRYLLRTASIPR